MLITVITASNYTEAFDQIQSVSQKTDGVELRLDYGLDFSAVKKLRETFSLPMIFTLRKKSQGGLYSKDESERLHMIEKFCELQPEYVDIEYDVSREWIEKLQKQFKNIKWLASYHNFDETPENLEIILQAMQHPVFSFYKIAAQANSTLDALRMFCFLKKNPTVLGLCMGELGQSTRLLAPIFHPFFIYAAIDENKKAASGQLTLDELISIYHVNQLNAATKIYALLGDPVKQSVGHILHNQAIRFLKQNAVYIKLLISKEELPKAISYLRQLPFYGFSITMPLKETIVSFVDELDEGASVIQAINTIVVKDSKWIALNTDGLGAVMALNQNLSNKKILLLGAGGAARAILYETKKAGAIVTIVNRTLERAEALAKSFQANTLSLERLNEAVYDIIINTVSHETPLNITQFIPKTIAMDCVYQPIETDFLLPAKNFFCTPIPGYEMFINQAILQLKQWFIDTHKNSLSIEKMMRKYFKLMDKTSIFQ